MYCQKLIRTIRVSSWKEVSEGLTSLEPDPYPVAGFDLSVKASAQPSSIAVATACIAESRRDATMVLSGILPTHHETQAHCAPSLDCTFSIDPQQTSGLHRAVWSSVNHNFVPLVASLIEMTSKMRLGMGPFLNSARGPTRCQHEPTLLRHREGCKLGLYV